MPNKYITTEHTKLKPLSVSIAVDADRRFILEAQVSQIPTFGHLPETNYQRYKGGRGCVVGQGELKKLKSDPYICN